MGKALIVSGGTDGQYTIGLDFARAFIDAEIAGLTEAIEKVTDFETAQREQYEYAKLHVEEIKMALDAFIDEFEDFAFPASTVGLIAAHNSIRIAAGLGPLAESSALTNAAQGHSNWMRDNDTAGHTGAGGSTPRQRATAAGYAGVAVGENAAAGQHNLDRVMDRWMNSPGHRAAILNPGWDQIGIGYAYCPGGLYWHFWTVKFGRSA